MQYTVTKADVVSGQRTISVSVVNAIAALNLD